MADNLNLYRVIIVGVVIVALICVVAAQIGNKERKFSKFPDLPCTRQLNSCNIGLQTVNTLVNNTITNSTAIFTDTLVSVTVVPSNGSSFEISYDKSSFAGSMKTENSCWQADFSQTQFSYYVFAESVTEKNDLVLPTGSTVCSDLMCADSGCTCSEWKFSGTEIILAEREENIVAISLSKEGVIYKFGEEFEVQGLSFSSLCLKPTVTQLEKPQWWQKADEKAYVTGYDAGSGMNFQDGKFIYWVFSDTILGRTHCSRPTYGPGISSSGLRLTVSKEYQVTEAEFYPVTSDGCPWFVVDVAPEQWVKDHIRAWPNGGLTIGNENVIFYNQVKSEGFNLVVVGSYFATSNLNELDFKENNIQIPTTGQAFRRQDRQNNDEEPYVYFLDRYTPYGSYHCLRLARVADQDYKQPDKYQFYAGRDNQTGDITWKTGSKNAFLLAKLNGNPQASLIFHQPSQAYWMLTSTFDRVFLSKSVNLVDWTEPVSVFVNPRSSECFMYCAYWHPELSPAKGTTFFFTASFGNVHGGFSCYQTQLLSLSFETLKASSASFTEDTQNFLN
mmetsp:Transcript_41375/g.47673  ORF Transcript_41375/g.47673 Transcript_41375/m.47673 type:complete len:559 (-) Transcript_41375:128-1804(-)|eukprot:CAMPEP_0114989930 /NCGR_PEP_ID=MMETSP0216-20121206/10481_1 /TAXON_ID=223996 /ORGANISM="Protocruzia adherens, Strain Boccale" /LENGTH=558 /DNA_ID=CAMNT_0002352983 /DNA_START=40 /DNA_END=1716 /DNA_ORIENTATION=+